MLPEPVEDKELLKELEKFEKRTATWKLKDLEIGRWYKSDVSANTLYYKANKEGFVIRIRKIKDTVYFRIVGKKVVKE